MAGEGGKVELLLHSFIKSARLKKKKKSQRVCKQTPRIENDNQILGALLGVQKNSLRESEAWHALAAQWEFAGLDRFQGLENARQSSLSPVINYLLSISRVHGTPYPNGFM